VTTGSLPENLSPTHPSEPAKETDPSITSVRVLYPDLHGIARGKDVPIQQFDGVVEHGLCFCAAVMGTDLRHTPVVGGEAGYPDLIVRPDLATMVTLPWEPGVACCLANIEPAQAGTAVCDPRGALARAVATVAELGFEPIVGPELEFFLIVRDPAAPNGIRRHVDNLSMVYTVGPLADPQGLVRRMTEQLAAIGLDVFAMNHEFMNSQYEINLRHSGALDAADRAFRLKAAVKDIAAQNGLHATFMGKPFNDQGGSGTHLHISLNRDGANAFTDPAGDQGVSEEMGHFTAGLIEHAPALMALLNPTVNAYRRIQPDSLAPTHANWGWDNRASFVRIPPERGGATRVELRVGDGAANPYLGIAATLLAGADGMRRKLTPPPAVSGDAYRADADVIGTALPHSLDQALAALAADTVLREGLGEEIVGTFLAMKGFELERHRAWVSDWEISEYLHHL
jgi:glutamine synthetase